MKRVVLFVFAVLFCSVAIAQTINWYVDGQIYQTTTCTSGNSVTPPTPPAKYGYTFKEWQLTNVPLEYIETSGTQYIDTGFKPNQDTRVVMESETVEQANHDNFIFGARSANMKAAFTITWVVSGNKWRSDYGIGEVFTNSSSYAQKLKFDKNKNVAKIYNSSGNLLFTITNAQTNFNSGPNLIYPGGWSDTTRIYLFDGVIKIYSFKLYDNGVLIRDMIPVLDNTGVPCMYDKVEGKFYYNAGTGNFIAGPVISE